MGKWALFGLASPGCLLAVASALALALGLFGRHPVWPHQPMNLSEAAATRDEAELVRLIEHGNDPNAQYVMRPGLLFDSPTRLTPLEAAVAAGDAQMVRQLAAHGLVMDAGLWNRMRCAADGDEMSSTLDAYRPTGGEMQCDRIGASPTRNE